MSSTNTNVRSLRDKFQYQQANQYANPTKNRQERKEEFSFQCVHCGRPQTAILLLQSSVTEEIVRQPSRDYDSDAPSRNIEQENKSSALLRRAPVTNEEPNGPTPPLRRSNYDSDVPSRNLEQENKISAILRRAPTVNEEPNLLTSTLRRSNYESDFPPKNIEQENKTSAILRRTPVVNEEPNRLTPPLRRSNYESDFPPKNIEQDNKTSAVLLRRAPVTNEEPNGPTPPLRRSNYDSDFPSRNLEQENKNSVILRRAPVINEEPNELTPPLHRSNYAFDFRGTDDENVSKIALERSIKGFVDGCVRSSVHELSYVNREADTQDIVEVEVEYDPILGNVTSTRKRSSTIITNLDHEYRPTNYRQQSLNSRYQSSPIDSKHDDTPIWARSRKSNSTVKPSDLVREYDKKEKLEPKALRRLSRTDLVDGDITPNSPIKPTISTQDPAVIKDTILRWCQDLTQFYKGVNIRNFSSSWSDGLAFCALIHRFFPDEFNFDALNVDETRQNFDLAFTVALQRAGIEPLIDTDDMLFMGTKPDSKVVFTYVQSLYRHLSRTQPPSIMREHW